MGTADDSFRVLFCGCERNFKAGFELTQKELAGEAGVTVECCLPEEVPSRVGAASLLVPFMTRVDSALLAAAPRLRYVLQFGVGLEGVDLERCRAAKVRVANIPSVRLS